MGAPFPPGARLAAYLRDSGGDKQDVSVSQQETAIRAWCNDHGLILTAVFADRISHHAHILELVGESFCFRKLFRCG